MMGVYSKKNEQSWIEVDVGLDSCIEVNLYTPFLFICLCLFTRSEGRGYYIFVCRSNLRMHETLLFNQSET